MPVTLTEACRAGRCNGSEKLVVQIKRLVPGLEASSRPKAGTQGSCLERLFMPQKQPFAPRSRWLSWWETALVRYALQKVRTYRIYISWSTQYDPPESIGGAPCRSGASSFFSNLPTLPP